MCVVVSYPGNFQHAQQAALAFHERGVLEAFVTALPITSGNFAERASQVFPAGIRSRVRKNLARRYITEIPPKMMRSCCGGAELLRTIFARYCRNEVWADAFWDHLSYCFDRTVARKYLCGTRIVHAFEYTARYTFERARELGVAKVLAMPSTSSRQFELIKSRETERFPELRSRHDAYFARRFGQRQERRDAEIALADLIVANSEVTKQSHILDGADPGKIVVVPLAGPPVVHAVTKPPTDIQRPLSVVWAGSMIIRKGAQYFIDAWRMLSAGDCAQAKVYGGVGLPERVMRPVPQNFQLMGPVPQQDLFGAFEQADVLVFPTLADGFGMVVTEAFSRGLPIITTDRAGASDLVEHKKNGLIVPAADSAALADALRWCLDNRAALYDMRFHALATARRWQWPDYRRTLIARVGEGLQRMGYRVEFGPDRNPGGHSPQECASVS